MKESTLQFAPIKTNNNLDFKNIIPFHVMAKPAGSTCNLDCTYCFYLHKQDLLQQDKPKMSYSLLETYIKQYIESQNSKSIFFSWQGGEPTILGLDFFEKIIEYQKKHQPIGVSIENDLQTNGILLDDDWGLFLKRNRFLVGISIDGPRELHDKYRLTRNGKPTFDLVINGINVLKKHQVPFNALVVINRFNAKYPTEIYNFLTKELGVDYIQFNPCVEATDFKTTAPQFWNEDIIPVVGSKFAKPGEDKSIVTDWSVDPDDWGDFLKKTFELWVNQDLGRILVNLFETAVAQVMGMESQLCITAKSCGKGVAIEHDGSVFSCDHYVYPEYKLGNINNVHIANLASTKQQQDFGNAKNLTLPNQCDKCKYLKLCWGECPKNRLVRSKDGELGLNYLCPGITAFFDYAYPILLGIVAELNSKKN